MQHERKVSVWRTIGGLTNEMFDYTRNIYLLIIMHFLWDYILFSGATKQIPVYAVLMGILQAAEIVIMLVLLARKWRQDASAERT